MSSLLKNVLLLALLLGLGLVLLGAFNAGVKVKGDTSVYKTIATTWDAYIDTATWSKWRHLDQEVKWVSGRPGQIGASWEVDGREEGKINSKISEMIKDSMLVIASTGADGMKMREVATFSIDNGQAKVEVERLFEIEGFLPNVGLNWEMTSLEKNLEVELKAFKALFETENGGL